MTQIKKSLNPLNFRFNVPINFFFLWIQRKVKVFLARKFKLTNAQLQSWTIILIIWKLFPLIFFSWKWRIISFWSERSELHICSQLWTIGLQKLAFWSQNVLWSNGQNDHNYFIKYLLPKIQDKIKSAEARIWSSYSPN